MATDSNQQSTDYFPIGAMIQCETCLGEKIDGEVVAYDSVSKLLALKTFRSGPKKSRVQQLQLINVNFVGDVIVIQEAPAAPSQAAVPNFNYGKINKRAAEEAARKRRSVCADSVSPDGQKLFVTIRKTIDDLQWDGERILVMSAVIISPPYKSENIEVAVSDDVRQQSKVTRSQAQGTADHMKKIIDKFWSERAEQLDDVSCGSSSTANSIDTNSRNSAEPLESGVDSKRATPT